MRTPAGTECPHYTGTKCLLIDRNPRGGNWNNNLCKKCPAPEILRRNRCPNMILEAWVSTRYFLLKEVRVEAYCTKSRKYLADPAAGCGECLSTYLSK